MSTTRSTAPDMVMFHPMNFDLISEATGLSRETLQLQYQSQRRDEKVVFVKITKKVVYSVEYETRDYSDIQTT